MQMQLRHQSKVDKGSAPAGSARHLRAHTRYRAHLISTCAVGVLDFRRRENVPDMLTTRL